MAPKAIRLLVARDAALQVLPGRLRVTQDPEGLIVMEGGHHPSSSLESEVQVALPAEGFRVVAGGAFAHTPVSFRAVGGHEVEGVEAGRFNAAVALKAAALRVAGSTLRLSQLGFDGVARRKASRVKATGSRP
jgi:hypothetical protein